jgi:hypothetical protein
MVFTVGLLERGALDADLPLRTPGVYSFGRGGVKDLACGSGGPTSRKFFPQGEEEKRWSE